MGGGSGHSPSPGTAACCEPARPLLATPRFYNAGYGDQAGAADYANLAVDSSAFYPTLVSAAAKARIRRSFSYSRQDGTSNLL
ncbi:unnamed protein product [Ixodes persulcatus]